MIKTPTELVFLGATAFREIAEIVRDINRIEPRYSIRAILDDNRRLHGTAVEGTPVVGCLEECRRFPHARFVMGIGSYKTRLIRHAIIERLGLPDERYAHLGTTCAVAEEITIAAGAQVAMGSVVLRDVALGGFVLGNPARRLRLEPVGDEIARLWEERD